MGSSVSTLAIGVALISVLFVPVGLYMLISGVRGRRMGEEPRCGKCGYIVLHLPGTRCPECGSDISARNTVIGVRRRSWTRLVMGSVLLILGVGPWMAPVTMTLERIPWYHYRPTNWVMDDLDIPATYAKAMAELQRRDAAGSLSQAVRRELIEMGLKELASAATPARQELIEYLGNAVMTGQVTQEQKDRFLDQACATTMRARPVVAEGDRVPFEIRSATKGPTGKFPMVFWMHQAEKAHRRDGRVIGCGSCSGSGPISGWVSMRDIGSSGKVGKHSMEVEMEFSVWHGSSGEEGRSELIGRRNITGKAMYEVRPRGQAPEIEMLDSPELRQKVLAAMKVERVFWQNNGYLNVTINMKSVPCDLAFDVFGKTAAGELKLGSICCVKGKGTKYGTGGSDVKEVPDRINIVLRPSREVARSTVDETAIYGGEVMFPVIAVEKEASPARPVGNGNADARE